jgi:hypothetical protein
MRDVGYAGAGKEEEPDERDGRINRGEARRAEWLREEEDDQERDSDPGDAVLNGRLRDGDASDGRRNGDGGSKHAVRER